MKVKLTLEVTLDPKEGEREKTTKFEMQGDADKDFPMDKLSAGIMEIFSLMNSRIGRRIRWRRRPFDPPMGDHIEDPIMN